MESSNSNSKERASTDATARKTKALQLHGVVRESAAATPHQVNAPNYSRNSHKESYGSNDMVYAYFLEDARKMTQDKTRIPSHKDMASTRAQCQSLMLQNGIGQRFSLNKSSAVHEKPHTPRSCLRWKPTGRIFKTVSLRWIPTGKVFIDSTTKVDSEPPNGSNDDITNPYECNQTLYVSAGTSNSSAGLVLHLDVIRWQKRIFLHLNLQDEMNRSFIAQKFIFEGIIQESHSGFNVFMKNLDDTYNFGDQFLHDKPTEDDQEKSKVIEESDSTIPDPSHQTVTSIPPMIAPFTDVSSTKPSLLVTHPPINTEATTITTSLPEITPFIALQLRVARLEQEMSEVKKTDHSIDVLASIKSQVPTVVDKYLGTKNCCCSPLKIL
ncbi:hypothetical protein Tco_0268024 [Tanacetum coccineum]